MRNGGSLRARDLVDLADRVHTRDCFSWCLSPLEAFKALETRQAFSPRAAVLAGLVDKIDSAGMRQGAEGGP